jgi:Undecaprenyl-phosphate galactose phosphotransferase WbaP
MQTTTILFKDADFFSPKHNRLRWAYRRAVMSGFMVAGDLISLIISLELALLLWSQVRADLLPALYQPLLLPVGILFLSIYTLMGLYPGVGLGSVEELRRLSIGTTLGMLGLMALSFYLRSVNEWSRAVLGLTLVLMLISAPLVRRLTRRLALRLGLWGMPVAVIGENEAVEHIFNNLRRNWLHGLLPVLSIKTSSLDHIFPTVSQLKNFDQWDSNGLFDNIDIAIIVPNQAPLGAVKNILLNHSHQFKRVIVMFNEPRMGPMWFTPLLLAEHLGLEAQHQLINPVHQLTKRLIDIVLIIVLLPFLIPVFLLIMLAIRLDSPGSVFYTQKRIGAGGHELRIWKFRTMVKDAEEALEKVLEQDSAQRNEWEQNFKLKNDPRITRVGRFLRRTSLDELPQLWNVLRREMSLIGPRPIVAEEVPLYKDDFEIYKQVLPGMTGMWQISGRNDLTYDERIGLDVYYVQNWSIWLDLHILIHTVLIVLGGRGAY